MVGPAVESAPGLERLLDQRADPLAAPGDDPLQHAHAGVVPLDGEVPAPDARLEEGLLLERLGQADLPAPLEGGVGLRHEGGEADLDLAPVSGLSKGLVAQIRDAPHVLLGFRGEADHEVELDGLPARVEDLLNRRHQVRLRVPFVDHVPQALRPRLGRQREARLADAPDLLHQGPGEGLHPHGGERDGDPLFLVALHERGEQGLDPAVVAGAQRKQRQLAVPGRLKHLPGHGFQKAGVPLPDGPPDHARLAETAPARAAPGDLEREAVVDRLHQGDDGPPRPGAAVEVGDDPLPHGLPRRMQGGRVHALDAGQPGEPLPPVQFPLLRGDEGPGDFGDDLLPLADHEGVDEAGHRGGVEGAGAAGDDQRVLLGPLFPPNRDPRQVQHVEDIGVAEFVLEREADGVEALQRRARFQRGQGDAVPAHLPLHVRPGRVAALGGDPRVFVQDRVEDLEAEVRHPHLVAVREGEGEEEVALRVVLPDGVDLPAGVAAGLFDGQQDVGPVHGGYWRLSGYL